MGSSLLEEYEQNGFAFRRDVLSADEVGVLTTDLDEILAAEADARRVILEADGVTPRTVVNPHLYPRRLCSADPPSRATRSGRGASGRAGLRLADGRQLQGGLRR